jgi:hypothetical protein
LSRVPKHKQRRSSVRATSAFNPRPARLSAQDEAEAYLQASREKLAVAQRQLEALREAEVTLTEEGFAEAVLGDEANIYLIEGHADGMLLELAGAFDAFACAVAFRMGSPNPHGASFPRDDFNGVPRSLELLIGRIRRGYCWKHLNYYRNLAAHKVVLASPGWRDDSGIHRLRLPDPLPPYPHRATGEPPHRPNAPVMPILENLLRWAVRRHAELNDGFVAAFP